MEVSPRTKPVSLNPINSDIKYSQPTHSFAVITLRDSLTFLRKIYKKKKAKFRTTIMLNPTLNY